MGMYTAINTAVMAKIGPPNSRAAIRAESQADLPSSRIWRSTFSTTIMASSTTNPMANTKAKRVNKLMEYPNISMTRKVPIKDRGMAITGITTARTLPRNKNMTAVTIRSASNNVLATSVMESVMYSVESYTISPVSPVGSLACKSGKALRTRLATSSILAPGATLIPMNTDF